MESVRVGVIGVGYLGKFHAEKYARMKDVELVGVVDVVPELASSIAQKHGTKAYSDYRDLIGKVDAVSIVVPTPLHFTISRDFLEGNIHILLEKPMTETLEQADALIRMADERNLIIQIGHLERFNPAVMALNEVIHRPWFIESHRLALFNERGTEVDVVLDLMIHDIDIILNLVKSEIKAIDAVGVPVVTSRIDIANARLNFENGCVANVTASRISMKKMRKIRIFQKDAYVSVDYAGHEITIIQKNGRGMQLPLPGLFMDRKTFGQADSLEAELVAFVASVKIGGDPLVSARDGRRALQVAMDIIAQIETNTDRVISQHGAL